MARGVAASLRLVLGPHARRKGFIKSAGSADQVWRRCRSAKLILCNVASRKAAPYGGWANRGWRMKVYPQMNADGFC
jgi:hypothetical protein